MLIVLSACFMLITGSLPDYTFVFIAPVSWFVLTYIKDIAYLFDKVKMKSLLLEHIDSLDDDTKMKFEDLTKFFAIDFIVSIYQCLMFFFSLATLYSLYCGIAYYRYK